MFRAVLLSFLGLALLMGGAGCARLGPVSGLPPADQQMIYEERAYAAALDHAARSCGYGEQVEMTELYEYRFLPWAFDESPAALHAELEAEDRLCIDEVLFATFFADYD